MSEAAALSAIFTQMTKLVKNLSHDELQRIASGDTQVMLAPKGTKIDYPLDLPALASEIRLTGSQDDIVRLLAGDSRLNPANLRKLADELNISVPSAVKAKAALQLHIAQSAAAHWQRTRGGL